MAHDRDNLLRGQGLLRQGITVASNRWKYYFKLTVCVAAMGAIGWPVYRAEPDQITDFFQYEIARVVHWVMQGAQSDPAMTMWYDGKRYLTPASVVATDSYYIRRADELARDAILGGIIGTILGGLACIGFARLMRERGKTAGQDKVICGSVIVEEKALRKMTSRQSDARSLHIATVPLPAKLECRHFALLGTTGAGKTTVLRQMLDGIDARGESALVYDTSSEFITHYYRPERGDVILNPFDARSAYWSPFAEIAHPADADRIAHQLVTSTGKEEDDVWLETARILVANILRVLGSEGKTTLPDLLDALQAKTKEEMKVWLAGTSSARTFEADAERATGGLLMRMTARSKAPWPSPSVTPPQPDSGTAEPWSGSRPAISLLPASVTTPAAHKTRSYTRIMSS